MKKVFQKFLNFITDIDTKQSEKPKTLKKNLDLFV